MPPPRKIKKEDIINVALEILKKEDIESLNARKIAKELNSSVQPIYHNFENMENLKEDVFKEMYKIYQDYIVKASAKKYAYKEMGLAYIKFARDYPNYFKFIFMSKTDFTPESLISNDDIGNNVIEKGMELTGFSYEEQKKFHVKVWMFTHGIASLVATNTVKLTEEEIDSLLKDTVGAMISGMKGK